MVTWATAEQIDWFELQAVGRRGLSPTRTVTEHDVLAFAGLTGDMAELHTSETYARQSEFGGRIAHGMLNLSLAHGLIVRSGRLITSGIALLGWSEVRFRAPVRLGDTVQAEWETIRLRDSASNPAAGIVTDKVTLRTQDGTVAMTGEVAELVRKRPA